MIDSSECSAGSAIIVTDHGSVGCESVPGVDQAQWPADCAAMAHASACPPGHALIAMGLGSVKGTLVFAGCAVSVRTCA